MEVTRKYEDITITFNVTDEEIIQSLANRPMDERTVFFRKLFQTDIKKTFTFKFLTQLLK